MKLQGKEISLWFEEASSELRVFTFEEEEAIFHSGFKISRGRKDPNLYKLRDARFSDDYSFVRPKEIKEIRLKGFIKGVDDISNRLTLKRTEEYKKRVSILYAKRKRANREMSKDIRLNKKRIRNANKNIDILVDQIFLFQAKTTQYNNKYK